MLIAFLLLIGAVVMVHHNLVFYLIRQDYRIYLFIFDFIYKKTFDATGVFPLWQNYQMCGISYIVNYPFMFSLSRILTLLGVPAVSALFLFNLIFMLAGSISFFLLMRIYRCNRYISFLGALCFQFVLYKLAGESYPLSLAAVIFLICEKYDFNPKLLYILLGAISIGITCSSGVVHGVFFIFVFQILLMGYYFLNRIHRNYCLAGISSWALGIVLSLPTLLPQIRDLADSQRLFFQRYQISLQHFNFQGIINKLTELLLLQYLFPVSLIIYILVVISIFYLKDKKIFGFWLVTLLIAFLYIFLSFTQGLWKYFPFLGRYIIASDLNRIICIILFSLIFIVTLTINTLVNKFPVSSNKIIVTIVSFLTVIFFINLPYLTKYPLLIKSLVGGSTFLFITANLYLKNKNLKKINIAFSILFIFLLAARFIPDYFYSCKMLTRKAGPPLVKTFLSDRYIIKYMDLLAEEGQEKREIILGILKDSSSSGYFRTIDIGLGKIYHEHKFLANQIYSIFGFANIYPARYHEFFKWLIDDLKTKSPQNYRDFVGWGAYAYGMGSSFSENLLSLAGVKWIIIPKGNKEIRFRQVLSGDKYSLYQNDKVFPRAFPVFGLTKLENKEELAKFMMSATVDNFLKSVPILASDASDLPLDFINEQGSGTAKIARYNPNEVLIETNFSENGLLVLTDNFHRSWKATVDNIGAKIYPAYYTFRMVNVPKGRHTVKFYLSDNLFFYSLLISLIALMVMSLTVIFIELKQRRLFGIAGKREEAKYG